MSNFLNIEFSVGRSTIFYKENGSYTWESDAECHARETFNSLSVDSSETQPMIFGVDPSSATKQKICELLDSGKLTFEILEQQLPWSPHEMPVLLADGTHLEYHRIEY